MLQEEAEPEVYSYTNKKYYEQRVQLQPGRPMPWASATQIALDVWRGLGGRDGGRVDVRCDANGRANFIEANPLAGLHPKDSDLVILGRLKGVPYVELIERIVASALSRSAARSAGRAQATVAPHEASPAASARPQFLLRGPADLPPSAIRGFEAPLSAPNESPPAWDAGGSLVANRTKGVCFQSIAIGPMMFQRAAG